MEINDLVGGPPAAVEPIAPITAQTVDPVGAVEAVVTVEKLEAAFAAAAVNPPDAVGVLEPASVPADTILFDSANPQSAPELFPPSGHGLPIVEAPTPAAPQKDHRPRDERGFKYAWQRNRADGRRF